MRIAHFVHRYPPAPGGAEAYFAQLSRALAQAGHQVTVFTTNALDLQAFWSRSGQRLPAGRTVEEGVEVRRYPLSYIPCQRYLLRALSLFPLPRWQAWTVSCTPLLPELWRECGQADDAFDIVHAAAFPYSWPLLCAQRLASRLDVPFLLTPFVHLGDLAVPDNAIRRIYTQPALMQLARSAARIFVQTAGERQALRDKGIAEGQLVMQGMGILPEECIGGEREQTRASWGIGANDVVVGHLANLSEEKGSADLLRAAELAWRQGAKFEIVLAGASMPNFQRFFRRYGSSQRIRLLGHLSVKAKRDFFAAIDVFALPSRVDSFGLVFSGSMGQWGAEHRLSGRWDFLGHPRGGGRPADAMRRPPRPGRRRGSTLCRPRVAPAAWAEWPTACAWRFALEPFPGSGQEGVWFVRG